MQHLRLLPPRRLHLTDTPNLLQPSIFQRSPVGTFTAPPSHRHEKVSLFRHRCSRANHRSQRGQSPRRTRIQENRRPRTTREPRIQENQLARGHHLDLARRCRSRAHSPRRQSRAIQDIHPGQRRRPRITDRLERCPIPPHTHTQQWAHLVGRRDPMECP